MRDILIHFLDRIKEYEHESGHSMYEDGRESSEVVDTHLNINPELKNHGDIMVTIKEAFHRGYTAGMTAGKKLMQNS